VPEIGTFDPQFVPGCLGRNIRRGSCPEAPEVFEPKRRDGWLNALPWVSP